MEFANDILLIDETSEGVNLELELWRNMLQDKSLWIKLK